MFKVRQIKRVITGKSFGHCPVPEMTNILFCCHTNISPLALLGADIEICHDVVKSGKLEML